MTRQRSRGAERAARRRQRLRDGIDVYPIEVDCRIVETLIAIGWLSEADSEDKKKTSAELSKALIMWSQGKA